jgi:hypothetical protein
LFMKYIYLKRDYGKKRRIQRIEENIPGSYKSLRV